MSMALMLAAVALTAAPAAAQESAVDAELAALKGTFTYRQGDIALGDGVAMLRAPDRFRYLGPDDAKRLLEDGWYNPPGDAPLGMLIPVVASPFSDEAWGVVITFEEDGYVEDDDASTIRFRRAARRHAERRSRREGRARGSRLTDNTKR